MFYREAGQFKKSYAADMAVFPILQDRIGIAIILFVAAVIIPLTGSTFFIASVICQASTRFTAFDFTYSRSPVSLIRS